VAKISFKLIPAILTLALNPSFKVVHLKRKVLQRCRIQEPQSKASGITSHGVTDCCYIVVLNRPPKSQEKVI